MYYQASLDFAKSLDQDDPLAKFRQQFHFPQHKGQNEVYLCGHSLGLQPKITQQLLLAELEKWQNIAVRGHFEGDEPWVGYERRLSKSMATLVGALPAEVTIMNTLTVNLHLMMVSFFRPQDSRNKILIEHLAFPSDRYAVTSQLRFHGLDPDHCLIELKPRSGEHILRLSDIEQTIAEHGQDIALILLPGVQYYTGQVLPMAEIVKLGHAQGCQVGFDLAHAVGNLQLSLHDWNVDFACWCTYKYLNAGPGSLGACYIHERHCSDTALPRFDGWWGHKRSSRFMMGQHFQPDMGANAWQISNPPILSLVAIRASLQIFDEVGGMTPLVRKAKMLNAYLIYLIEQLPREVIAIITPNAEQERGSQISLVIHHPTVTGKALMNKLQSSGFTCDWREPNVIRIAPIPLYNNFQDVFRFGEMLTTQLS